MRCGGGNSMGQGQPQNPDFNSTELDGIRKEAGPQQLILTAKRWIESTGGIGLIAMHGRYGHPISRNGRTGAPAFLVRIFLLATSPRANHRMSERLPIRMRRVRCARESTLLCL